MHAIPLILPLLLLTACPALVHVHVVNASDTTITLGHFDASYPLKPGETRKLVGTRDTDGWRVERRGFVYTYGARLEVPARHTARRGLYVVVRLAVDAEGRLWLLPPKQETRPRPVEPQPAGFPIEPSRVDSASHPSPPTDGESAVGQRWRRYTHSR